MIIINLERFNSKNKLTIYTGVFVKFYNQKNCEKVYEIYGIIEFEKINVLTVENLYNFR